MSRWAVTVVVGIVALLMGGCADPGPDIPAGLQRISGTVTVAGQDCSGGAARPSPVSEGTAVIVENAEGAVVARSELAAGQSPPNPDLLQCVFPFVVEGVPEGLPRYTVRVGDDRGLVEQFGPDQLEAPIRFLV